jgi:hypothetical protein
MAVAVSIAIVGIETEYRAKAASIATMDTYELLSMGFSFLVRIG